MFFNRLSNCSSSKTTVGCWAVAGAGFEIAWDGAGITDAIGAGLPRSDGGPVKLSVERCCDPDLELRPSKKQEQIC